MISLQVCVYPQHALLSQHTLWVVSQYDLQQVSWEGEGLQPHIQGESGGGSSTGPQPRRKLRGTGPGGCLLWGRCLLGGAWSQGDACSGGCLVLRGACSGGCLVMGVPGGHPPDGYCWNAFLLNRLFALFLQQSCFSQNVLIQQNSNVFSVLLATYVINAGNPMELF